MATDSKREVLSDIPIPPGETLAEEIGYIGMTQQELANRMDVSPKLISEIIPGKEPITHDIAAKLEGALGIPADLWVNLERRYRLTQARLERQGEAPSHLPPVS